MTSVHLVISPGDGVPIYLQIVNQIRYLASSGQLRTGDELPAIRTLAEELLVNPNTVARAYRELEIAGIVEKRRTAGTFISAAGTRLARRERLKIIIQRLDALVAEARQMGVSLDELTDLLHERDALLKAG